MKMCDLALKLQQGLYLAAVKLERGASCILEFETNAHQNLIL